MSSASNRLRGLAAAVAILALVVGAPVVLLAIGATPWTEHWSQFRTVLSSPDDGTLALLAMGGAAWISWAVAAVSFAVEIVAALRGVHAPRLPGLGGPQRLAGEMVAAAAALFATATVVPTFAPQPVQAAIAPVAATVAAPSVVASPAVAADQTVVHGRTHEAASIEYVVRRGDSLWKIAEERLGDGNRYREIVALNRAVLHGAPSFIDAGLVLRLPADAVAEPVYVVEAGDTLTEIAAEELGDADRYPEIFEASRATPQPDGQHLSDPDLIRPGWHLTIPSEAPAPPVVPQHEGPISETPVVPGKHLEPSSPVAPPSTHATSPVELETTPVQHAQPDQGTPVAAWVLPGLLGAGSLLAGSLWLVVRAHRRTQQRYRRPGYTMGPVPESVRDVEKTARLAGQPMAEALDAINRLLMDLRAKTGRRPRLSAVEVTSHELRLHLSEPAELPAPWTGADTTWEARLDAHVEEHDLLRPYPMLVSVGIDDEGHLWLLDLEAIGFLSVTGDPGHCAAFARHLVADLALSPWTDITEIGTIDLAPEFASINSWHLEQHQNGGATYLARLRGLFAEPTVLDDPEPLSIVIMPSAVLSESSDAQGLVDIIQTHPGRCGLALVSVGDADPGCTALHLSVNGSLQIPNVAPTLTAAGLTSEEAAACAALVDLTSDASNVIPIPRQGGIAAGWRALADSAGAVASDCVEPRTAGVAGDRSLLPEAAQRYEAVAATTAEDVATLAPVITEDVRDRILAADPDLDRDLADWADSESVRPKLHLLGPVRASGRGAVVPKINERRPFYAELMAYLALHPEGVSAAEIHEIFGIQQSRARSDVSLLREWFGTDPRTGEPFLPRGASGGRGGAYKIHDVLVDLDLFRRLRLRAQAKGADGMDDLLACLNLVEGEPFSALRKDGWNWMLDEERLYETAGAAIVDVAHIVTLDALSRHDLERAERAAETACRAAPYDEVARLDLAKVAEAEGDHERAEKIIRDEVCNRSDDGQAPIDLPERSAELLDDRRRTDRVG